MSSGELAIVALAIVAYATISKRLSVTVVSAPMVFVAAGLLTGSEVGGIVSLDLELETIVVLGEATLGVVLFADAGRLDLGRLRQEYRLPARLLGIGLPLTVAATAGLLALLIDGVDLWHAALIAAILSPTDAALGQAVVTDPAVPPRIRQGLTVESGLNDGLIVPAVALFLAFASADEDVKSAAFWGRFVVEQIGIGFVVGVTLGAAGAWLLNRGRQADYVDGVWAQLATLALAIAALTLAIELGGNGFIATFVAGLTFGHRAERSEHLLEFTEDSAQLAAVVSFFVFGNVLLGPALAHGSVSVIACSLAVLTIGRMVPVAVSLFGSGSAPATTIFVGWFGPRGLASILFGLLLLEEQLNQADELFAVVAWTVALSVLLHGATAAHGAGAYGRWWSAMSADDQASMPESLPVPSQRIRRV